MRISKRKPLLQITKEAILKDFSEDVNKFVFSEISVQDKGNYYRVCLAVYSHSISECIFYECHIRKNMTVLSTLKQIYHLCEK